MGRERRTGLHLPYSQNTSESPTPGDQPLSHGRLRVQTGRDTCIVKPGTSSFQVKIIVKKEKGRLKPSFIVIVEILSSIVEQYSHLRLLVYSLLECHTPCVDTSTLLCIPLPFSTRRRSVTQTPSLRFLFPFKMTSSFSPGLEQA